MRIYKCDRCGEKFAESSPLDPPQSPKDSILDLGITTKMPIQRDRVVIFADVDLCGPCVKSLLSWMYCGPGKETKAQNP